MSLSTVKVCPPYDLYSSRAEEFRALFGLTNNPSITSLTLQQSLIDEEARETYWAASDLKDNITNKRAREAYLKELVDLLYVIHQCAQVFGWDIGEAYRRVHESNLSKLVNGKPLRNEAGKVMKGPNYKPPSLIDLV